MLHILQYVMYHQCPPHDVTCAEGKGRPNTYSISLEEVYYFTLETVFLRKPSGHRSHYHVTDFTHMLYIFENTDITDVTYMLQILHILQMSHITVVI